MRTRAAVLVLSLSGCSFLAVPAHPTPTCTDSYVAPVLDTIFLAASVVSGVLATRAEHRCEANDTNDLCLQGIVLYPAVVVGATALASSIWGYAKVRECHQVKQSAPVVPTPTAPTTVP